MVKQLLLWFYQNVWGNLVASVIWALPTFLHLHRKVNRLNKSHQELHVKLDNMKGKK
jgi:hypothetical protein